MTKINWNNMIGRNAFTLVESVIKASWVKMGYRHYNGRGMDHHLSECKFKIGPYSFLIKEKIYESWVDYELYRVKRVIKWLPFIYKYILLEECHNWNGVDPYRYIINRMFLEAYDDECMGRSPGE
jgi:hypothetical protein